MNVEEPRIGSNLVHLGSYVTLQLQYPVTKAWLQAQYSRIIVLMDYTAQRGMLQFRNLVAYSTKGDLLWEAELPTGTGAEAYVDAELDHQGLHAFSFSCFRCLIDPSNGKIIRKSFSR